MPSGKPARKRSTNPKPDPLFERGDRARQAAHEAIRKTLDIEAAEIQANKPKIRARKAGKKK